MATVTKTFTENLYSTSVSPRATWTIEFSMNDIVANANGYYYPTPPVVRAKYVQSGRSQGYAYLYGRVVTSSGVDIGGCGFQKPTGDTLSLTTMKSGTFYALTNRSDEVLPGKAVSTLFNENNPTQRSIPLNFVMRDSGGWFHTEFRSSVGGIGKFNAYYPSANTTFNSVANIVLNAPPYFRTSSITYSGATPAYANYTSASVTVSNIEAKYGGNISGVYFTIGNQTVSQTSNIGSSVTLTINPLTSGGTFTPRVTVIDSRGQETVQDFDPVNVSVYTNPSVEFQAERASQNGAPNDEGTYVIVSSKLTFSDAVANAQAPTVSVLDEDGLTVTSTTTWYSSRASDGTVSGTVTWNNLSSGDVVYGKISLSNGFNTQKSYLISVTPNDTESAGTTITQTLATAFYTVDFLAGGHGIAFGQACTEQGFWCNMDAHFVDGNAVMRALFDFMYPVGSYYETSDTSFNPNTTWGGTWSLETAGQVHVSSGTNYAVSGALTNTTDGGASSVLLADNQIAHGHSHSLTLPNHKHGTGNSTMDTFLIYNHGTTGNGVSERAVAAASSGNYMALVVNNANTDYTYTENTGNPSSNPSISGSVTNLSGASSTRVAHSNMQPYIVVNRWHRTA